MADQEYQVLSAMLSPALFMTATGSLLISANNRLARVVDRFRQLAERGNELARGDEPDRPGTRLLHVRAMITLQRQRASVILRGVATLYAAFALFVGTSLAIAINYLVGHIIPFAPTGLGVLGVCLLLVACSAMLHEARLGIRTLQLDANFHESMQQEAALGSSRESSEKRDGV